MKLVWEEEREEIESDGQNRAEAGGMMVGERQRDRQKREGREEISTVEMEAERQHRGGEERLKGSK